MIEISQLTYSYPGTRHPALRDVSLNVESGEFVLVTGPSGAGKSSLLRALSGLVPHFSGGTVSGTVRVAGRDPIAEGPQRLSRIVGTVFQSPEAQAVLERVEDDVAFALENAAIAPPEMRVRVEEALHLLELTNLRNRPLHTLSGGERQRAAIAAALALRPQILALDEPTSQLDPQAAADVLKALARLNQDLGLTIILSEHRLERVLRYVQRVVALEEGRVVADGPVPEVLEAMNQLPPIGDLGRRLSWNPLPLTVTEARRFVPEIAAGPPNQARSGNGGVAKRFDEPLLEARDLHFSYGSTPILRGVDLTVHGGETVALMGRNGSGKSTLLKTLVGLLPVRRGSVAIKGHSIAGRDVADICRDAAYLPQAPDDLLFADTVREELETTLRNHRIRGAEAQVDALLARLGLESYAGAYPRDLSVGERQRVSLGALMVTRPSMLLLDEPTRGLDYKAKENLVSLWQHWKAEGLGLLLVTHDVELAAQVADRVLLLSDGEIVEAGAAGQVLSGSPLFAPQMARLFPGAGWLTVDDAVSGLKARVGEGTR